MKIYNRKGFAFGSLWTVLGVVLLVHTVLWPETVLLRQLKDLVVAILALAIGIASVWRAFSKKLSREDFIETKDERNRMIRLKTKAKVLDLMFGAVLVLMAAGLIGYMVTENLAWAFLFFGPCLLLIFYWIVSVVVSVYYEHHE